MPSTPNLFSQQNIVMFLDDFESAPPAGRKPSFLDDDEQNAVPSFLSSEGIPGRPGTSGAFLNLLNNNNRNDSAGGQHDRVGSSAMDKAAAAFALDSEDRGLDTSITSQMVLSSAEELHFSSTSLRHRKWDLYRHKILGKGSFGCATLYSLNAPSSPSQGPSSGMVVVKDVNIQTMTCREEEMAALKDEVTALERVAGHPNVVQLLDYHHDEVGMMAFIITEFCGGGDLGAGMEKAKQGAYVPPAPVRKCSYAATSSSFRSPPKQPFFPEEVVASVLIQTAVALHHLHVDCRMLHRDLKLLNLFLLSDGITVRLGDFGVVALLKSIGEKAKAMCGSPFYMAPEVYAEKPYDGEADIWSLGVLLYEMMALARPFNAATQGALTALVKGGKCVPLWERTVVSAPGSPKSSHAGGPLPYSRELMELVMSMLTLDPGARPTLRRLLRSTYVRRHLYTVPKTVLQHPVHYGKLFEAAEWKSALDKCLYEGVENKLTMVDAKEEDYEDDFEDYEDDFEDE